MSKPNARRDQLITDEEMLNLAKAVATKDKHFARWVAVFEARRALLKQKPKGSWKDAYKIASKRLEATPARGTPRTMRSSYAAIQRKRRGAVKIWL